MPFSRDSPFWRVETLASGVTAISHSSATQIAYTQGSHLMMGSLGGAVFKSTETPFGVSPKIAPIILRLDAKNRPHLLYLSLSGLNYVWKSHEGWVVGLITDRVRPDGAWDLKLVLQEQPAFVFEDSFGSMISFERQKGAWKEGNIFEDFKEPARAAFCMALGGDAMGTTALVRKTREGVYLGVSLSGKTERFLVRENAVDVACRLAWDTQSSLHGLFLLDKDLIYGVLAKGKWRSVRIAKNIEGLGDFAPFDLALDKDNEPHVVFYDASKKIFEYRFRKRSSSKWVKRPGIALESLVGPPKIFVDQGGAPWIFFIDGESRELKLARGAGLP